MELLKCHCCLKYKPVSEFHKATKKARGYSWKCKECRKAWANAKKEAMGAEAWTLLDRKYRLKCQYGISNETYDRMLLEQDHKCKICGIDELETFDKRLRIDHDHLTGKVRGLLCHHCNTALGKMKDSVELLKSAITYLENS